MKFSDSFPYDSIAYILILYLPFKFSTNPKLIMSFLSEGIKKKSEKYKYSSSLLLLSLNIIL